MQRPISPVLIVLTLLWACAALPGAATAEESQAKDPFAGLPAPSEDAAFAETLSLRRGPTALGMIEVKAEMAAAEGADQPARWSVRDGVRPKQGVEGAADLAIASAELDQRLVALRGSYRRTNRLGFLRSNWERTDKGYTFEQRTQEFENLIPAAGAPEARSTLSGLLLFLRLAPKFQGSVEYHDLDPDPEPGEALVSSVTLRVEPEVSWRMDDKVVKARVATWTRGQIVRYVAVHPQDGRCLGLVVRGLDVSLTPEGVERVALADPNAAATSPLDDARNSASKIRDELPPGESAFAFEGELVLEDWLVGRVEIRATPASHGGRPAWSVEETIVREAGEAKVVQERTATLAQDLTVLEGSTRVEAPAGKLASSFERKNAGKEDEGMAVRLGKGKGVVAVDPRATFGLFPVIRFLMHVPDEKTRYTLPGFDPRFSRTPKTGSGRIPADMADAVIDVEGATQWTSGREIFDTFAARVRMRMGQRYTVHLSRDRKKLIAVVGDYPSLDFLPKGSARAKPPWFAEVDKPAKTALHAFIKFGRGYHLPDRKLLDKAFHWPSMLQAEIAAGSWPKETRLEAFKEAWIQEFVNRSKNRTKGDCDDLLLQILMTGSEEWHMDGSMTLKSTPTYGGHSYRIQELDGVWHIIKVD